MTDALKIETPKTIDLIDTGTKYPALSATSDMPVIETKPDAANEGKPPETTEAPAAPPAEVKQEGKTEGESATPPAESAASDEEPAKKPAKGVQKALDRLTKRAEEAERKAREAEENLTRTLKAIEEGRLQPPKTDIAPVAESDPEPVKPNKGDFSDPEAWDAALIEYADQKATWTARREVKAAREADEKRQTERAAQEAQNAIREAHAARVEKAAVKYEDFHEVAESPDVQISIPMAHAIINHDQGPDIQYYLGKHPEEAKRIASIPNIAGQLVELGVIAASLRTQSAPAKAESKPISTAPAPIKPTAAATASVTKSPDEMSMDEYASWRKAQLQAERRPGRR